MTGIRPLERGDIPQVAGLLSGRNSGSPRLTAFLERQLLDHPWSDPELPSLVCVAKTGEILGAIASNPVRMLFEGRPIHGVCSSYLVTHPSGRGAGAILLRALLSGRQDLTFTDAATKTVRQMWERLGGRAVHLGCLYFVRLFRPWQLACDRARDRFSLGPLVAPLKLGAAVLDRVSGSVAPGAFVPRELDGEAEPLAPADMIEYLPVITEARLHVNYDLAYLEWVFGELAKIDRSGLPWLRGTRGPLWAELVRTDGRVVGWYVCYLRPGGICRLLQLAASEHSAEIVLGQLFHRAWKRGAAGVHGRLEPRLLAPLVNDFCLIRPGGRFLVHSRQEAITNAIVGGDALLTRLDGEWWSV